MLQRKMLDTLRRWKQSKQRECLLVKGARQVGKSYIIEKFGSEEYENLIVVDFIKMPDAKEAFEGELTADGIFSRLSLLMPGTRFVPGETLLFLDEIQECPQARTALKYLALDDRIDVIASGSLLGIAYREQSTSVPVGYERQVEMRPLDFEEFLWALGYDPDSIGLPRKHIASLEPIPASVNKRMMELLKRYLAVGGMPAVVQAFVDSQSNFGVAHEEQRSLLATYEDDIARYATATERVKARACYQSLPRQLAKENTKFQYSTVEKRGTARKFGSSIDWLDGARMVLRCNCVSTPQFPLAAYEQGDRFRLYANDTGLLMGMYDFPMKKAVVDNTLKGPMKGGLYENLIACMLASQNLPLRYWMSQNGSHEIEFLLDGDASVIPIEVKAKRGSTASLNALLDRNDVSLGIKFIDGNIGIDGKKVTLPLYLAAFLREGLKALASRPTVQDATGQKR